MGDRAALEQLLRELKLAATPIGRVKLLGRAWRVLRRLDPGEMRELATEAGLDRAEGLLERLARSRGKLTPGLVLPLLKKLRGVEARQVDAVVRSLRNPRRRDELLRDGLDAVESWLEPAPVPVSPETPPVVTPHIPPEPIAVELDEEAIEEPPAAEPVVASPPPVVIPRAVVAAPPLAAAIEHPPIATSHREPEPQHEQEDVRPRPEVDDLVTRLAREKMLLRRLRLLRQDLEQLRDADVDTLERVLESFQSGWSRRRALSMLLSAGIPAKLMHAVYLIEQLASPSARRWCTGALLDHRQLTSDERQALAERHGVFRHRRIARAAG